MIPKSQHLNPKIFDKDVEMVPKYIRMTKPIKHLLIMIGALITVFGLGLWLDEPNSSFIGPDIFLFFGFLVVVSIFIIECVLRALIKTSAKLPEETQKKLSVPADFIRRKRMTILAISGSCVLVLIIYILISSV